jgi:hypothetical protein
MKRLLPEAIILCAIIMVVSYGFAQSWTKTSAKAYAVQSIALSADGKIIMSVGSTTPVVSTNRGIAWISITPVTDIDHIASSADGTKLIGVSYFADYTYVSTDSGNTWNPTGSPIQNWRACAISADGSKLFAAVNGGLIYSSTNFGTNWISIGAPTNSWSCLALSADGTKLAAGAQNDRIYTSTNSGVPKPATSSPSNSWASIASSADGSHLVATCGVGTYVSTNSGGNWTKYNISGISAASSADGSKLIICNNSYIYTSTNFGMNWTTILPSKYWFSVASSADGCELLAGENQGIWIYQATPSPQLNLAPSDINLALSWLVPSTNFVLQQSTDLISWSSVTNAPALNLTNLQNQVTFPATSSIGFYRLATP